MEKPVCTSSQSDYVFLVPDWRMKKIRLAQVDLLAEKDDGSEK